MPGAGIIPAPGMGTKPSKEITMTSRKNTEAPIVVASTGAVATPSAPEVFEQSTDNTSTGAVEFRPEGTTTAFYPSTSFTVSHADPGPIVVTNSWRGDVVAKIIQPPAEETPIYAATEAETKASQGTESNDTGSEPG